MPKNKSSTLSSSFCHSSLYNPRAWSRRYCHSRAIRHMSSSSYCRFTQRLYYITAFIWNSIYKKKSVVQTHSSYLHEWYSKRELKYPVITPTKFLHSMSPLVSDTYVVCDPCITTQHEFGTNSARTQTHNMDNFAAFIGSRKEDYWLIQTDQ